VKANKVMLITGSAKRLGAFNAAFFHQAGWNIVLHYNQSAVPAINLAANLNQQRPNSVRLVQGSFNSLSDIKQVGKDAIDAFGRLDCLINNASAFYATPMGTIDEQDWTTLVGSNMQAPLFLAQSCVQALKETQGSIINMVDIHAMRPLQKHSLYCMAKAALVSMTYSLAQELAPLVRVNGIAPGAILWPETDLADDQKSEILRHIPLQRIGSEKDIAQGIEYLLNANYVTGQILAIDGGRSVASQGLA
jgi:pteridine reductase